ncbi:MULTISPECIES: DUF4268 domain-containing protein [Bradyrhizobium]|nr:MULTISPECIES: DUF4268 domain-containing protein [Bradyrhizobium]
MRGIFGSWKPSCWFSIARSQRGAELLRQLGVDAQDKEPISKFVGHLQPPFATGDEIAIEALQNLAGQHRGLLPGGVCQAIHAEDYDEIVLDKGSTQRIMLIVANFRKEVTSTILWLLNFKLRIQCFRVRPWSSGSDISLAVDQIIPTKDIEEFMIGLASKSLDEVEAATEEKHRYRMRPQFWAELLRAASQKSPRFANISPNHFHYVSAGSGGVAFRSTLLLRNPTAAFSCTLIGVRRVKIRQCSTNCLKAQVEATFGGPLIWERLDNKRASRIQTEEAGDFFDETDRPRLITFMVDAMYRFEASLKEPLSQLQRKRRVKSQDE